MLVRALNFLSWSPIPRIADTSPDVASFGRVPGPAWSPLCPSALSRRRGIQAGVLSEGGWCWDKNPSTFCFQVGLKSRKQRRVELFLKLLANDAARRVSLEQFQLLFACLGSVSLPGRAGVNKRH